MHGRINFSKYHAGAKRNCDCRKLGISCSMLCMECMGFNCKNDKVTDISEEDSRADIDVDVNIKFE